MTKSVEVAEEPKEALAEVKVNDEHLSSDKLKSLLRTERSYLRWDGFDIDTAKDDTTIDQCRPTANFIDLMNWVYTNFAHKLTDQTNLNKFVHNRIVIDGQFLHYAKLNDITITVLHKDSVVSFNTDEDYEKFFVQGIFLIKSKDAEFIMATSWHKGNQNDDEISFFVIASEANFPQYIKLRNAYDAWVQEQDRSNLRIHVVGNDDIPYDHEPKWDDLFLPDETKTEMKEAIEGFLKNKEFYDSNRIPWKTGWLLFGEPGTGKAQPLERSYPTTISSPYQ